MKATKRLIALLISLSFTLSLSGCIEPLVFLLPKPEQPKIKHGEFPFELVCEIDGQEVSFKDNFVIEHTGISTSLAHGKYNTWDTSFLNSSVEHYAGHNEIFLKKGTTEDGYSYRISFYLGSESYYMGVEESTYNDYERWGIYPGDFIFRYTQVDRSEVPISKDAGFGYNRGPIDEETLYEEYNIKVIKKSISEPLPNNVK